MKKIVSFLILFSVLCILAEAPQTYVSLPQPAKYYSLSKLLDGRMSIRNFTNKPLTLTDISTILWSSDGITTSGKHRTIPSAMALHPLEIYIHISQVKDVKPGIYRYSREKNALELVSDGDKRQELLTTAVKQEWIKDASAIILITANTSKIESRAKEKSLKFLALEAGAAMQNVYLMAESLGLGTCAVGGYDEVKIKKVFSLREAEEPMILMPIGSL